jgi:hypothetical protein
LKIEKMSDEQCLEQFIKLLESRVSITTAFAQENETGILTHQYLKIECGEHTMVSQPELLDTPLMLAPAGAIGASVN